MLYTAPALKWRLVVLGALTATTARAVPDAALRHNGRDVTGDVQPPLFSRPFTQILGLAVEGSLVSARRAAELLDLSVDDLRDRSEARIPLSAGVARGPAGGGRPSGGYTTSRGIYEAVLAAG